jgi:hypothetical protein
MRRRGAVLSAVVLCAWPSLAAAQVDLVFLDGFQWTPNHCREAEAKRSTVGCEFWPADLDNALDVIGVQGSFECQFLPGVVNTTMAVCANASLTAVAGLCDPPADICPDGFTCRAAPVCILDAQHSPFAIQVVNPQTRPVAVTVRAADGTEFTEAVPAGQAAVLRPQLQGIPDQSLDGTGIHRRAYRVTADAPVSAYQLNATPDAGGTGGSLLLPRATFDVEYFAVTWPSFDRRTPSPGANDLHGYVSVVAPAPGTVVEVTPRADVRASASQGAIPAGTVSTFLLDQHDVLTLQAVAGGDLSGTRVSCPGAGCAVFAGHEGAGFGETVPPDPMHTFGPCCADHLEEMMFPAASWGRTFAVARSAPRTNEPDRLRVVASRTGTVVTFLPPVSGPSCPPLGPGESCEVKIWVDTTLTSNEPILVGHYLQSAIWGDGLGNLVGDGDPALALAAPVEQFRREHTLTVPSGYPSSYLAISGPAADAVRVDGLPVALTPFGVGFQAGRFPVGAGVHQVSCPAGCHVLVHGYATGAGYMFASGLDLVPIVVP